LRADGVRACKEGTLRHNRSFRRGTDYEKPGRDRRGNVFRRDGRGGLQGYLTADERMGTPIKPISTRRTRRYMPLDERWCLDLATIREGVIRPKRGESSDRPQREGKGGGRKHGGRGNNESLLL